MRTLRIREHLKLNKKIMLGFVLLGLFESISYSMPINFGFTQGDMEYKEMTSPDFRVYFDSRVPEEGAMAMQSLTTVKPMMEKWMGVSRDLNDPLRVVMSNVSTNASFANFIYDAIELQTPYQNIRDLAWHEYAHSSMYLHYNNIFGSPGTILHILFMPAWFLEGLAEVFSVSVGSDYQSGVERWQALSGSWPTYDRLHSLYQNPKWSGRGYATAGSLTNWILRRMYQNPESKYKNLGQMLKDFKDESQIWNLFTNFAVPMEAVLESSTGDDAEKLYEEYKGEANAYWQVASPYPFLSGDKRPRLYLGSARTVHTRGKFTLFYQRDGKHFRRFRATFDKRSGWMTGFKKAGSLIPKNAISPTHLRSKDLKAYVKGEPSEANAFRDAIMVSLEPRLGGPLEGSDETDKQYEVFEKNIDLKFEKNTEFQKIYVGGRIQELFETTMRLGWFEFNEKERKLCSISKRLLKKAYSQKKDVVPQCQIVAKGSYDVEPIGYRNKWNSVIKAFVTEEIWFRLTDSSTTGDRHRVIIWNARTKKISKKSNWPSEAKPVSVAFAGKETWVLAADRHKTHLWQVDKNLNCVETLPLSDFILGADGLKSGEIILSIYEGFRVSVRKIKPSNFKKGVCYTPEAHTSPLMEGMRSIYASTRDFKNSRKTKISKPKPKQSSENPENKNEDIAKNETDESQKLFDIENIPTLREVLLKTSPWKSEFLAEAAARKYEKDAKKLDPNQLVKQKKVSNLEQPSEGKSEGKEEKILLASASDRIEAFKMAPNIKDEVPWNNSNRYSASDAVDAELRWSSPLYFPWIGADDPQGVQLGMISVPLIDDMQNHTLRATILVGVQSLYPQVDLTYSGRRWKWPLDVSVYQRLTYNGSFQGVLNYWDDKGVVVKTAKAKRKFGLLNTMTTGWKTSYLTPEIGYQDFNNQGVLNEPYITLSTSKRLPFRVSTSLALGVKYAGELINPNFDYYKLSMSATAAKGLFSRAVLKTGISYAQTRGTKFMLLREYYTPLKTYIPGTGAGLNQSNFNLFGDGSLFAVKLGDSKIRYNIDFSTPVIADIDKSIWFLYAERLDFTAFFNYGGIWDTLNDISYADVQFVAAHGYNLDLFLENKGVRFNVGVGLGQVFGEQFNVYAKFGFDAFF